MWAITLHALSKLSLFNLKHDIPRLTSGFDSKGTHLVSAFVSEAILQQSRLVILQILSYEQTVQIVCKKNQ